MSASIRADEETRELNFCGRAAYNWLESPNLIGKDKPGDKVALTGNGALARGIIEAGVKVMTHYPGFPTEAIADLVAFTAEEQGIYVEFSVNEKVAFECAAAAAISGLRSLTLMKDHGLNVAMDAIMPVTLTGVKGGMVIISGDDPGALTSPHEQDTRGYARYLRLPCFDPSSCQEAKDMLFEAYRVSEEVGLPVLFRVTAQLAYGRSMVELGAIDSEKREIKAEFEKDISRYIIFSGFAKARKEWLYRQLKRLMEIANNSKFNVLKEGTSRLGVVTSGRVSVYVDDAIAELGLSDKLNLLKIGMSYPLPEEKVKKLLEKVDKVIVFEELDPFIEEEVMRIVGKYGARVDISGKLNGVLPITDVYTIEMVTKAISEFAGKKYEARILGEEEARREIKDKIPSHDFGCALCCGCPHAATLYATKQAIRKVKGKYLFITDIGCYTQAAMPPWSLGELMFCMGSSVGLANGFYHAGIDEKIVALIGDSTILHAGIPPVMNLAYNQADVLVIVCDNRVTAASGHPPGPMVGINQVGRETKMIEIEDVVNSLHLDFVRLINPFNLQEAISVIEEALRMPGQRVVISRAECQTISRKKADYQGITLKKYEVTDECTGCKICTHELACAAIYWRNGKAVIDAFICTGCGLCEQVCPIHAIELKEV